MHVVHYDDMQVGDFFFFFIHSREADTAFSSNDISKARVVVAKIKYYNSIYEKVKALEREHGIID